MSLADYYHRDEVAISQVLHGFQAEEFSRKLKGIRVSIAFGEEASTNRDGRYLLDLSTRLMARFYPSISFSTSPEGDEFANELIALARRINPKISVAKVGLTDVTLSVGEDAPAVRAPTILYAGCDGWMARVGTDGPYSTSDLDNPFGAGFSACLAVANMFRYLFLQGGSGLLDSDITFPEDSFPDLFPASSADPLVLVGLGAIGNSAAWALSRVPVGGLIHLVDHQSVELSNLQRYVLCERGDEGGIKAQIARNQFTGALRAIPHRKAWDSFVSTNGYRWRRVLVALDSARDRRAVQASLPCWIANAWTQTGDLGVSSHSFLGQGACLSCLYLPTQQSKNEDQIIAEALRIPQLQTPIRQLLGTGQGVDKKICDEIASAWGLPIEALAPYVGRPIRDLWVEGVCGGGFIPLGGIGDTPGEMQVPLAFQSALAGILLAAEAVRDILNPNDQTQTYMRQIDVLSPLGATKRQMRRKAGGGHCICEDQDFIDAYQRKYRL